MFHIIEDCDPFYIRFTHAGFNNIISTCLEYCQSKEFLKGFTHEVLDRTSSKKILEQSPISNFIKLNEGRVSLFITNPGHYYRAHKDGLNHRFSINYTVKILDKFCITNWYSDIDLKKYPIDNLKTIYNKGMSREAAGFIKENHRPIKTMIAEPNEIILFNTDIFHDFDNRSSSNQRIILTLRAKYPANIYFEDVKKILYLNKC